MTRRGSFFYLLAMGAMLTSLAGQPRLVYAQQEPAPLYSTITVTTTKDDITKNGNCTLREAVQAANKNAAVDKCPAGSSSSTDTIKLGTGTYILSIPGRYEHYNLKGDIDITQSVKIIGTGRSTTIVDGKTLDRVFENRSTTATVTIQDMTIQNALAQSKDITLLDEGGAIANKGTLYITRVRFYNNKMSGEEDSIRGGAILSTGSLIVSDSQFEKNRAGGGGAIGSSGKLTVDKSTFKENSAYAGGAIYSMRDTATVNITNSLFQGNQGGPGGASAMMQEGAGTTNIRNSTFEGHPGGDELIWNEGTMTVRYSTFQKNRGSYIFKAGKGFLTFTHSNVKDNSGSESAIHLLEGRLVLDRLTFSNNGGPALYMTGGDARLNNSTITMLKGNQGAINVRGGKLAIEMATIADNVAENVDDPAVTRAALTVTAGTVTLHSTILANTRDLSGDPVADCKVASGTTTSLGYNLISRAYGCGITAAKGDQFGTLAKPIEPLLGELKDNGGYNYTRGLLPGSPAIDKADPVSYFATDQRVYHRPAGAHCDIGAYERGAVQ